MKQKQFNRSTCYKIVSVIIIAVLAFTFAFPLYETVKNLVSIKEISFLT